MIYDPSAFVPVTNGILKIGDQCGVQRAGKTFEFLGPIDPKNYGRDVATFSSVWHFLRLKT